MRSKTLRHLGSDYLRRVGRPTLKAVGLAVVAGGVTFVVAHQGWQASIEVDVLVAMLIAVGVALLLLARTVGGLDEQLGQSRRVFEVVNQRVGAHRAIAAWVNGCEVSLRDAGRNLSPEALVAQELKFLEQNTLNSLAYPFYSDELRDRIRSLAVGEPGESVTQRLDALLVFLKRNLEAGSFLVYGGMV